MLNSVLVNQFFSRFCLSLLCFHGVCSLVADIVDGLGRLKPAIVVDEFGFVEGLWLVELHPVLSAHLIGVQIALGAPVGAVPELAVGTVARGKLVTLQLLDTEQR